MGLPIADSFGRAIRYLRISVTDRCNLRCVYCMPEHGVPYETPGELLTVDEIMRLVTLLAGHGLRKVRITGGEPLVRARDVIELTRGLSETPGIADLGLTTNGILLAPNAQSLRDAGLSRINISLDTLRPERFKEIARFDKFRDVMDGIAAAKAVGFDPIKLNMVMMKGVNDDEAADFARLTLDDDIHVRFLEYMPIGEVTPWEWRAKYFSCDSALERIAAEFALDEVDTAADSTSRRFQIRGAKGFVELISPISHKFCDGCSRLRLTANGALAPCLSDNYEYDIKTPLRAGASDGQLLACIREAVANKPRQSDFEGRAERGGSIRIMAQIGG